MCPSKPANTSQPCWLLLIRTFRLEKPTHTSNSLEYSGLKSQHTLVHWDKCNQENVFHLFVFVCPPHMMDLAPQGAPWLPTPPWSRGRSAGGEGRGLLPCGEISSDPYHHQILSLWTGQNISHIMHLQKLTEASSLSRQCLGESSILGNWGNWHNIGIDLICISPGCQVEAELLFENARACQIAADRAYTQRNKII